MSFAEQRDALVRQSAAQRAGILAAAAPLVHYAAMADRVVSSVRRRPIAVMLVAGAVAFLGSRKLVDIASRALTVYALFRR